jgi:hypothetical protein
MEPVHRRSRGRTAGDGVVAIAADWNFEEPASVICAGQADPNLVFINVVATGGNFANNVAGADVQISVGGAAPRFCSNAPSSQAIDAVDTLVLCPLCVSGQTAPADLAIQVTDTDGSVSTATCVFEFAP